jgi:hypothetical protein
LFYYINHSVINSLDTEFPSYSKIIIHKIQFTQNFLETLLEIFIIIKNVKQYLLVE